MASASFYPIRELSAYQSRWTIKAKVNQKSQTRTFSKGTAEGKVFSAELVDTGGGEIKASFFNDAATKYAELLQVGKVYTFTKGTVKVANKQYNNTNSKYELTFDKDAEINEFAGGMDEVFTVSFNFTDLNAVQSRNLPCRVDLCGVVTSFKELSSVKTKDGRELDKRDIVIADDTAKTIDLTLWAEHAKRPDSDFEGKPIFAFKSILVKEFNGARTGGTIEGSVLQVNPDFPEVKRIQQWWTQGGSTQSIGNFVDIQSIQSRPLPCRAEFIAVVSTVQPVTTVRAKDGRELTKRDISIVDKTGLSIDVTMWGANAQTDEALEGHPVIAIKPVLIKEFNGGRNAGTLESTIVEINPVSKEAAALKQWWAEGGSTAAATTISSRGGGGGGAAKNAEQLSLAEIRQRTEMLMSEQQQVYKVMARVNVALTKKQGEKVTLHYMACAETREGQYGALPCNKRVDESGFCALCNKHGKTVCRLNARVKYSDYSDAMWFGTFHEACEQVLSMPADKFKELDTGADGQDKVEAMLKQLYFDQPFELVVKAKLDSYNGEPRTNTTVGTAMPVNRRDRGRKMLSEIQEMLAVGPVGGA